MVEIENETPKQDQNTPKQGEIVYLRLGFIWIPVASQSVRGITTAVGIFALVVCALGFGWWLRSSSAKDLADEQQRTVALLRAQVQSWDDMTKRAEVEAARFNERAQLVGQQLAQATQKLEEAGKQNEELVIEAAKWKGSFETLQASLVDREKIRVAMRERQIARIRLAIEKSDLEGASFVLGNLIEEYKELYAGDPEAQAELFCLLQEVYSTLQAKGPSDP